VQRRTRSSIVDLEQSIAMPVKRRPSISAARPAQDATGDAEPLPTSPPPLGVLVVDDEVNIRETLGLCLQGLGCRVELAASGRAALDACRQHGFDLVFLDLRLGDESGLDLLPRLRAERPGLDVVVITAYASVDTAVEAMRRGAKDYLPKPFTPAQIRALVDRIRARRVLEPRLTSLEAALEAPAPEASLETASPRMRAVLETVRRAAARDVPVLLCGENGTGKGVLARAVHQQSARRGGPFVVVSCATSSEELLAAEIFGRQGGDGETAGRLESAAGGTLFLDEIGELTPLLQAKLLRVLETHRFGRVGEPHAARTSNARWVVATNRDLEAEVKAGRFRQDLLYRLNVMEVQVPPLRDRAEDVLPLARSFIAFFSSQERVPPPALAREVEKTLLTWPWPGNVRELRNVIERALILATGPVLGREVFPERMWSRPPGAPAPGGDFTAEEIEREHVLRVLARTPTLAEASRILDMDVTTLWRKRKRWGQ
jgi:two-component system, NtrC family, response regulator AlgB